MVRQKALRLTGADFLTCPRGRARSQRRFEKNDPLKARVDEVGEGMSFKGKGMSSNLNTAVAMSQDSSGKTQPALRAIGVRKVFDKLEAIRNVTVDIAEGEFVSLLGPSGCGKSSLLMMIAGLTQPTAGEIILTGAPVTAPRGDVGVVFQSPVLLPWRSVLDNVLFPIELLRLPRQEYVPRALELLKMVKLGDFA